jgi:hypothetical protein
MTETLKKLDGERVEVTTTRDSDVITVEKKDILREIAECEETIERNKRWLKQLE